MTTAIETDPRYPIGKHEPPAKITARDRKRWISDIAKCPNGVGHAAGTNGDARCAQCPRENQKIREKARW